MTGSKKSQTELNALYTNIMEFMKNCNIQLILFYGSLLGYYRENNFIEGDDDIDFIISENDYQILLQYLKTNKNSKIKIKLNHNQLIQLFYNGIGPFDVYVYNNYNDDILLKWDGNLLFSKSDIFPLKPVLFHKFNIFIPNNTEKIITDTYGQNWKTPQLKNIDYNWEEIHNVRKKHNIISSITSRRNTLLFTEK